MDHYTTLSVVLPAPTGVSIQDAQRQINAWMEKIEREANELQETDIDAWRERFCGAMPDLNTEFQPGISLVWFYADAAANVDATVSLIQDYLVTLDFPAGQDMERTHLYLVTTLHRLARTFPTEYWQTIAAFFPVSRQKMITGVLR